MMRGIRRAAGAGWLFAALIAPSAAHAAYYFESQSTGDAGASGTVTGWIDTDKARIEFRDGDQTGMFAAGSYLLTNDGGQTLHLVNPSERTISELNLEQIFQMVGAIMEATGGLVRMEFDDFTSEKLLEEPGEEILGYPTTHYRFKSGYVMRMAVLGMRRETRTDVDQELWCTTAIEAAGFDVWLRPDRFRTGNESIDQLIEQQYANVDCLPLRNHMVTTSSDPDGRSTTSTVVTEVTALREDSPPPGTFELPAGYEVVPLLGLPAGVEGGAGGGAPTGEEPERRRPRLRDLIGR